MDSIILSNSSWRNVDVSRVKSHLHAHDGEDEDDDGQYNDQVAQRAKCPSDNVDK